MQHNFTTNEDGKLHVNVTKSRFCILDASINLSTVTFYDKMN